MRPLGRGSVAFRTEITAVFAESAIGLYGLIGLPGVAGDEIGAALVTRLLMLGAIAICGNVYWCIERDRRSTVAVEREAVSAETAVSEA